MKVITKIVLLIVIMLCSSGCTNPSDNAQLQKNSSLVTSSNSDLSNEKIPAQSGNYYFSMQDTLPQDLPPQLIEDSTTAYQLSITVRNFLFYGGNSIENFDGKLKENATGILETAIYHTNPLELSYSYGISEGFVCEDYPNHVITKLVEKLVRDGKDPMAIFYVDDVKNTAKKLFGSAVEYQDTNVAFYEYFPEENVYIQFGELTGPRLPYPQITSYSKTENGYQCDVVLVSALGKDMPIKIDGETLTKENFEELTAKKLNYRYTFTIQEDQLLILTGLETLS